MLLFARGTQDAIVPDFHEPFGKDVEGKSSDELLFGERTNVLLSRLRVVFHPQGNISLLYTDDTMIAYRNLVGVASQIPL